MLHPRLSKKFAVIGLLSIGIHYAKAQSEQTKTQSEQTKTQSAETQIRASRTASNEAIARHDADGIVRNMLPDYSIVTGRGQHLNGKDSVLALWKKNFTTMPAVVYVRTPTSIVISKNDSLAWETGQWTAQHSYSGGGNYSAMWRKSTDPLDPASPNSWKLAAELFVSLEQ